MRATAPAALRYPSSSVAESAWASAMLSKFALLVSSGRKSAALMLTPSRSCTTRSYSGRLRRWNPRGPGFGVEAALSMTFSIVWTSSSSVSPAGRRAPGGGMMSARNLRIIFSDVSRFEGAASTAKSSSDRFPFIVFALWQAPQ